MEELNKTTNTISQDNANIATEEAASINTPDTSNEGQVPISTNASPVTQPISKNVFPNQDVLDSCKSIFEKLKLLKPDKYNDLNGRELSDIFSKVIKPFCCYNTTRNRWMYYNGKNWEVDMGSVHIRRMTKQFALEFLNYSRDVTNSEDDPFYKLAKSLNEATTRKTLIKDSEDNNAFSDEDFDADIYQLNLQNGTYDLMDNELHPHSYKNLITKIANVDYDPTAHSDNLDKFMNDIFSNNRELIAYVYRVLGYCLSGETAEEACFILLGETTRNGKSTLISTFSYMLGGTKGYATSCDIASLAKRKTYNGSAPSSDIARLKGARFVVASEPPQDFQFDEARLKSLTGGDRVAARMLRANEIEYTPTFKIIVATNHRPAIADDSILKSNRLRIIPFLKHFDQTEQNKRLKELLRNPPILNALLIKCLEGWKQYHDGGGLQEPQIVIEAIAEYKTYGQVFDVFFKDTFEVCSGNKIKLSDMYPRYIRWCTDNGFQAANKHDLIQIMKAKGVYAPTGTVNGKTYHNVLVGYKYKTTGSDSITSTDEAVTHPATIPLDIPQSELDDAALNKALLSMYDPEEDIVMNECLDPLKPLEDNQEVSNMESVYDGYDNNDVVAHDMIDQTIRDKYGDNEEANEIIMSNEKIRVAKIIRNEMEKDIYKSHNVNNSQIHGGESKNYYDNNL